MAFILALDLGGTHFRLGLATTEGTLVNRYTALTHPEEGGERIIQRIDEAIKTITSDFGFDKLLGMGIAAAGSVELESGVLLSSPNLPSLNNTPLKAIFEERLGIPVWVVNDASLAALGEYRFGAGRGFSHLIYITVSTGIGGGIIADNRLFLGATGLAAEIGHMVIDPHGPRCGCGNWGCLEALASGSAIARIAKESLEQGRESLIPSLVEGDLNRVTAQVVEKAARSDDPLAKEVMEKAGESLGIGVVNLLHLFDPQLIIIGGGVSKSGELIFQPVRRVIASRAMPAFKHRAQVVPSALGDDSGLLGAVAWVMEKCQTDIEFESRGQT